ncbi:hypothetical protein PM082_009165 [Marasmius tenuissimus]|nr:hypothetical protein PM082_009165 [Marasmius tenuissimus]
MDGQCSPLIRSLPHSPSELNASFVRNFSFTGHPAIHDCFSYIIPRFLYQWSHHGLQPNGNRPKPFDQNVSHFSSHNHTSNLTIIITIIMSDDYKRVILVTGSNTGIGYEIVKGLAQKGQTVYLAARSEAKGKEAQEKLKKENNLDVKFVLLNVEDLKSIEAARDFIEKAEGRLDVLVNNAGKLCLLEEMLAS